MNKTVVSLLTALAAVMSVPLSAADTAQKIFEPRFRTLKVANPDNFMAMPVIRLGTEDRLVINFDELGDDNSYLQYRLIHCNADWQPSRLLESEYLDGFNIAEIEDYAFSSGTYIHYVNYSIEVPSEKMSPIKSGNYLLQVFDRDEPETTLLQARFMVSENVINVSGEATSRTDFGLNTEWQQVNLNINPGEFRIRDPFNDLKITVSRNGIPANTVTVRRPQQIRGKELVYAHNNDLIFPASNEFRRFETVRADYPGMNVDSVVYVGPGWHAYLRPDFPRLDSEYIYDQTQHGRFIIDEYNATDPQLGADYVTVHFRLYQPEVMNADIYIDGEFTDHNLSETYRMRWNPQLRAYTLELPLKQGSYNYQYVTVGRDRTPRPDTSLTEGNKYETQNEYQVCVYLSEPASRADRLLGTTLLYSRP